MTALDIFFACRHRNAFVAGELQKFCALRLPTGIATTDASISADWISASEIRGDSLRSWAKQVLDAQRDRRAIVAATRGEQSHDLANQGLILTSPDSVPSSMQQLLGATVAPEVKRLRDSLRITRIRIVGYHKSKSHADSLAKRTKNTLMPILFAVGVDTVLVKGEFSGDTTSDSVRQGRVAVYAMLPKILMTEFAAMDAVRFDKGFHSLDEGDRAILAGVATQILARSDYLNGAVVEVVGYPDGRDQRPLAQDRANALKAALLEFGLEDHKVVTETSTISQDRAGDTGSRSSGQGDLHTLAGVQPSGSALARPTPAAATSASGVGFGLGWEAIAQAATDAIVARAERELQQYMLTTFVRRLCAQQGDVLRETCLGLSDTSENRYLPSLETLRSLLKRDAERLPEQAVRRLLSRGMVSRTDTTETLRIEFCARRQEVLSAGGERHAEVGGADSTAKYCPPKAETDPASASTASAGATVAGTPSVAASVLLPALAVDVSCDESAGNGCARSHRALLIARRSLEASVSADTENPKYAPGAVMALYAFDFARRVHRGDDPLVVLGEFDVWLNGFIREGPGLRYVDTLPALRTMRRFARYATEARTAAEYLRGVSTGPIPRDTLLRYAALQFVANAPDSTRAAIAGSITRLTEARRAVEDVLPVLDSIHGRVASLQTYGESTRAARRELYASAVDHLVQIGVQGFLAGVKPEERERMERLRTTLSGIVFSIRTEAYPQVLEQSLVLLQDMIPPQACGETDCPRTLATESVRMLTLAVDVSQAATEEDLRGAMSRFVDQGGSIAAKRAGRPTTGLHLNSYVGLGGGWREQGELGFLLRLPVGVEVVSRQAGKENPSWVVSGFAQIIDLGGFLPQQGDASDRSSDERLASVLSPGAFAMVSLASSPISLGVGVTSDTRIENDKWRVRPRGVVFAGVDVPLLRIR